MAFGEWFLALGELIWRISNYILGKFHQRRKLVKMNGKFFFQMLCACDFSLGAQRLVKLTPGGSHPTVELSALSFGSPKPVLE